MSDLEGLSGVRVDMVASHEGPFGSRPHFHEWKVWAYWPAFPVVDGRQRQAALKGVLAPLRDLSAVLGDKATNEGLAIHVFRELEPTGCVLVEVVRDAEGLSARYWRRGALG